MSNEPRVPIQKQRFSLCGARCKRSRTSCQQPAMANGRCRLHGGLSTGPRTAEGLANSRKANWKHGHYSSEAKAQRKAFHAFLKQVKEACL